MAIRLRGLTLAGVLVFVLTACALGDVGQPTPPPPITLAPPPTPAFEGQCVQTAALDAWLQGTATFLVPEFMAVLAEASRQPSAQVYDSVFRMARLRDAASERPTPDCATELQLILLDAMNTAVDRFQAFANGEAVNIGETAAAVTAQLEQVTALQNELISRLEAQYRSGGGQ